MGEFDYYDSQRDSKERRQRRSRYRNLEDDAFGMAEAADRADGDFANAEDYAGGLIDEEGRDNRYYRDWDSGQPNDLESGAAPYSPNPQYSRPGAPVPPFDPNQPSPAVQRAARLMERANRRGGVTENAPPRSRSRSRADPYEDIPDQQPVGNVMEMLGSFGRNLNVPGLPAMNTTGVGNLSKSILIGLVLIAFVLCSCLLLMTAWIISLFTS